MKSAPTMAVMQRPKSPVVSIRGEDEQPPRGMSPKMRNYLAVGVLAFCLIVGGGIIWFFLWGSAPKRRTVVVDPGKQTVAMPGMRIAAPPRNLKGVNKIGNNQWLIRGDAGSVLVIANRGSYDFRAVTPRDLGLTKEQIALLAGRFRILQDPLMAKEWNVTADQVSRLKAIQIGNTGAPVGGADSGAMRPLWDAYLKASDGPTRMDAQKKLTEKVDAAAKTNVDAMKKLYLARIEQIRQILTPEQIQTIMK